MDDPSPAPVFIVGAPRSGTTVLRLMLNEHPSLAIPSESHFLWPLLQRFGPLATLSSADVGDAVDIVANFKQWQDDFAHSADELRDAVGAEPLSMAQFIDRVFRLEVGPDADRWGDKTPPYLRWLDLLLTCFPAGQGIAIVRDPRDVYASLARLGWLGGTTWSIGRYLQESGRQVQRWSDAFAPDRLRVVRYEDLVVDTERVLRDLCEFLHLPFVAEMQAFFTHAEANVPQREIAAQHTKLLRPPSRGDVARWRQGGAKIQFAEIEALTRTVMEEHGYERRVPDAALPLLRLEARARHHARAPLEVTARTLTQVGRRARRRFS